MESNALDASGTGMTDYLRDISVMIVDEQPFMARLQYEMLRVLGCRNIQLFNDPVSAWKYYTKTPVDIIITDWNMRPIDGIEFTHMIRTDKKSPNEYVPIIMVTGYGEEDKVHIARDAGVNEYLIKPLSPRSLFLRIEAVIERPRPYIRMKTYFGPDRRRAQRDFLGACRRDHGDMPEIKAAALAADPFRMAVG